MTELSFLIELLLNHKLPKKTKDIIAERVKTIQAQPITVNSRPMPLPIVSGQAPSMQAKIEAMEAERAGQAPIAAQPVTVAAQMALMDRQKIISQSVNANPFSAKPEPGRTSPRKF